VCGGVFATCFYFVVVDLLFGGKEGGREGGQGGGKQFMPFFVFWLPSPLSPFLLSGGKRGGEEGGGRRRSSSSSSRGRRREGGGDVKGEERETLPL